jgi:hypothetical protein
MAEEINITVAEGGAVGFADRRTKWSSAANVRKETEKKSALLFCHFKKMEEKKK